MSHYQAMSDLMEMSQPGGGGGDAANKADRAEFERWASTEKLPLWRGEYYTLYGYQDPLTDCAWCAWLAARNVNYVKAR